MWSVEKYGSVWVGLDKRSKGRGKEGCILLSCLQRKGKEWMAIVGKVQ